MGTGVLIVVFEKNAARGQMLMYLAKSKLFLVCRLVCLCGGDANRNSPRLQAVSGRTADPHPRLVK